MSNLISSRLGPVGVAAFGLALALAIAGPTDGRTVVASPALTDDTEVPARLDLASGDRELRLTGDFTEGLSDRVAAMLAAHPQVERLTLDSDGGLVEEAIAVGRIVRNRGLATHVPDACASACTLVFLQGRSRTLGPEGRLGFHAPYAEGEDGARRAVDPAPERAAYRAAGLPETFVAEVMRVAPADLWIPDQGQLRAAGIVTGISPAATVRAVASAEPYPSLNATQNKTIAGAAQ
ncbi:hypothetical protein [Methylobacterium sp. SD21]|uniref:COG3904 family protein n=1 Tax=Methylobacterium litchii TaxID=3138810 RepID=UPI00313B3D14